MDWTWYYQEFGRMFSDWPIGTFVAALILVIVIFLIVLTCSLIFHAVDSWFLAPSRGRGRVVAKIFTAAHVTMIMQQIGDVSVPQFINHSDDWSLNVEVGGKVAGISVSEVFYNSTIVNEEVDVEYVNGRLSDGLYLKSIAKLI